MKTKRSRAAKGIQDRWSRQASLVFFVRIVGTLLVLAIAYLGSTAFGAAEAFPTPEAAATFFLENVKAEDYDRALEACAVDEQVHGFNYEAYIEWLRVLVPTSMYLPSEYPLFATATRHAIEQRIFQQLSWMALSVVLPPEYGPFLQMRTVLDSTIDFDRVVEDMDPSRFLWIEIVQFGQSSILTGERHVAYLAQLAEIHGAEAATSRAVLYEIDGEYFAGGFQFLQYEGRWLISSLQDALISQPATGALLPLEDAAAFAALLDE